MPFVTVDVLLMLNDANVKKCLLATFWP